MNEIIKLYKENPVRIIERNGEPWFVAKDVCRVLGIADAKSSLRFLDADEKGVHSMHTLGGTQKINVVNEAGLYSLTFHSRKPEAKKFKRWVTHEVLPEIRRNGAYISESATAEQLHNLITAINEQYAMLISTNCMLREQLEYAMQFAPDTRYGTVSPKTGKNRLLIRRGSHTSGKGRLIRKRNPEEVGYQLDLFDGYLPSVVMSQAVNFVKNLKDNQ
jgi:prophage antirepressor-like protein